MDLKEVPPSDCEVRAVIKFLTTENQTPAKIYVRLCNVYGSEHNISQRHVQKWQKRFQEGRRETHDEPRSGWPSDILDETIQCARALLEED